MRTLEMTLQSRSAKEGVVEMIWTTDLPLMENIPLITIKNALERALDQELGLAPDTRISILLDMKTDCYTVLVREKTQPKYLKKHIVSDVHIE